MKIIKNFLSWLSIHRYIFCLNPKDWNESKEKEYQKWAAKQKDYIF